MARSTREKLSVVVGVRLSPGEHAGLVEAARAEGRTVPNMLRHLASLAARRHAAKARRKASATEAA